MNLLSKLLTQIKLKVTFFTLYSIIYSACTISVLLPPSRLSHSIENSNAFFLSNICTSGFKTINTILFKNWNWSLIIYGQHEKFNYLTLHFTEFEFQSSNLNFQSSVKCQMVSYSMENTIAWILNNLTISLSDEYLLYIFCSIFDNKHSWQQVQLHLHDKMSSFKQQLT